MIKEIYENRKLIFNLGKNDFKTRFAGSYLGIIWAFVQPVITVVVYWFVFSKALNPGTGSLRQGISVPYVLWLIAGLVPWFFFSEVISTGTGALLEYNYLVKKVVFNVSILPVVRAISAMFTHLFFLGFMIVMYACYGFIPNLYTLQVIYYSIALMILSVGIIYITSAIVVFFRDLKQIVNIILQVGVWVTPIMWNIERVEWGEKVIRLLQLNPLYYIVNGYRESMIDQVWFWEHPWMTLYFWVFTGVFFWLGTTVFKKLKPHFADVL